MEKEMERNLPEGKILAIDTVSQNNLDSIRNHEILRNYKTLVLGS